MVDTVKTIIVALLLLVLVMTAAFAPIYGTLAFVEKKQCDTLRAWDTDHEYRWGFWTPCMVKAPNGLWVDVDGTGLQYNQVEIEE